MLEFIKKWLKSKFHTHDWETVEDHVTRVFESDYHQRPIKIRRIYVQRCKICNKIRIFKVKY